MKKIVAATVTLTLAAALAACGGKGATDNAAAANDAALNELVAPDEGNLATTDNDAALINDAGAVDPLANDAAPGGNAY